MRFFVWRKGLRKIFFVCFLVLGWIFLPMHAAQRAGKECVGITMLRVRSIRLRYSIYLGVFSWKVHVGFGKGGEEAPN